MRPVHMVERHDDGVLAWFSEADLGADAEDRAHEMAKDITAFVVTVHTEEDFYARLHDRRVENDPEVAYWLGGHAQ